MLPPRLVRRLVLAPMVIVLALGLIVLSPLLLLLALLFGLAGLLRAGRMRNLRLVSFLVVGLTAEIVTLVLLFGLWIVSGFGGRLQTEPYQSRHYAVVRRFLDALYRGAERTYGLRVEIDEPELTGDELAARLTRPVIVLSRHAGPGDSLLLVHQLLSVPPLGYIFQWCLSEQVFKTHCECGARHARRFGQGFDRPGCIHSVVNGTQGSAHLRIENSTKPSFVAFRSRRDMRPEYLDKQNLGQPSRDDFGSRRLFCHFRSKRLHCVVKSKRACLIGLHQNEARQ